MGAVTKVVATAYYSPSASRRYFSKVSAINAEAKAIILKRYPVEAYEYDTGHFEDIRIQEPERYAVMHRRLVRLIKASA